MLNMRGDVLRHKRQHWEVESDLGRFSSPRAALARLHMAGLPDLRRGSSGRHHQSDWKQIL